jgi:tryptophan 2,3-dioxygenase
VDPALTYSSYLRVDDLLDLQQPRSDGPEHDEMLFIVIHQVYELWFKELLHEIDRVMRLLEAGDSHRAQHTLKRILTILKVQVAQLDILETMTPLEFQSFRERLEAASGFQSDQFRQLEFTLGRKSRQAIARFVAGSRAHAALERRFAEPTLWDAFLGYLAREGYSVPQSALTRDVTSRCRPRRTAAESSSTSIARTRRTQRSANVWSISMRASRLPEEAERRCARCAVRESRRTLVAQARGAADRLRRGCS